MNHRTGGVSYLLAACASAPEPVVTEETIERVIRSSYALNPPRLIGIEGNPGID